MQLVSLLQWHLFSMQWFIFSSFYLSMNLIIHSHATSESVTMTFFVNAMIYKHIALSISESIYLKFLCQLVSLLQRRDLNQSLQWVSQFSSSESALMIRLIVSLLQRYEWNKLCYMHVVKTNQQWVCFKNAFNIDLIIESVT